MQARTVSRIIAATVLVTLACGVSYGTVIQNRYLNRSISCFLQFFLAVADRNMLRTILSPYYSSTAFSAFVPLAAFYSFISQLFIKPEVKALPPPSKEPTKSRVAIVTGSNTGIGFETAKSLANRYGYTVILACRTPEKAKEAAAAIGTNAVFVHPLDLSSFRSVIDFVDAIQARYKAIDILINNAGRNTSGVSTDGFDLQFQTNFVGHFLLTNQLIDRKILAEDARIINLASVMHHFCWPCTNIDSVGFWKSVACESTSGPRIFGIPVLSKNTYMLSKLAAILFTQELNYRYPKVSSIAVNPGAV